MTENKQQRPVLIGTIGPVFTGGRVAPLPHRPSKRSGERLEILEAGGVEPPSEKPCNTKTTCLSRSVGFADRAQNRQDALAASPMISPPHYGPKRDSQPTV